jgi:transposase
VLRKQKTDREDAQLLLKLLVEDRFPRIWIPSPENRDLRQLLWHRHRLVQMRTRVMNQLQAVAMNEGVRRKKALWSKSGRAQLESFAGATWKSVEFRRRLVFAGVTRTLWVGELILFQAVETLGQVRDRVVESASLFLSRHWERRMIADLHRMIERGVF